MSKQDLLDIAHRLADAYMVEDMRVILLDWKVLQIEYKYTDPSAEVCVIYEEINNTIEELKGIYKELLGVIL